MKSILIFAGLLAAAASTTASAQSGRAVPSPTRNVTIFTVLEKDLLDAVQRRDDAALDRIVAANFELRSAPVPGVPTARAESLRQWQQLPAFQSSIGQMAVHEYGDLMLVSFLWKITPVSGVSLPQGVFVVDTWKRAGADWQLAVRYAAPVETAVTNVPGAVAPSEQSLRKKM
jgi:hypothetical protein